MGSIPSKYDQDETIDNLKETIKAMKWRLSKLEADNAMMNKTLTNLKVSSNEMGRSVIKIHEKVFDTPVLDRNRSVRVPKESRSMYVK